MDHFFDGQIRRYLQQAVRVFNGFQVSFGQYQDGSPRFRRVPAILAYRNKMAASLMKNGSQNVISSAPFISVYIHEIAMVAQRRQAPLHSEKVQITERVWDEETRAFLPNQPGQGLQVERFMPVPFDITLNVDIWVTNELHREELFEQITTLFNPDLVLQSSRNPLDYSAYTILEMTNTVWTSRNIPIGTANEMDIMTLTFKMPIWINPPAKVKRQKLIHQIITNLDEINSSLNKECDPLNEVFVSNHDLLSRVIATPGDHHIRIDGETLTLLGPKGQETDNQGKPYNWRDLLSKFGRIREGISQIRIVTNPALDDKESDIVGTFELHPFHENQIYWNVEPMTMPNNSLDPVDAVIDPLSASPGIKIPLAKEGQRYLLTDDVGNGTVPWGNDIVAKINDVVEYRNGQWVKAFDALASNNETHFMLNRFTQKQLKFDGKEWIMAIDKFYGPGEWRVFL